MAACEKCWNDARAEAIHIGGDVSSRYRKLLRERQDRPCYLDCPDKHPEHYSYKGCPSCGYRYGIPDNEVT